MVNTRTLNHHDGGLQCAKIRFQRRNAGPTDGDTPDAFFGGQGTAAAVAAQAKAAACNFDAACCTPATTVAPAGRSQSFEHSGYHAEIGAKTKQGGYTGFGLNQGGRTRDVNHKCTSNVRSGQT